MITLFTKTKSTKKICCMMCPRQTNMAPLSPLTVTMVATLPGAGAAPPSSSVSPGSGNISRIIVVNSRTSNEG